MSIILNGTDQWAHRNTFPDMALSWSLVAWARRDNASPAEPLGRQPSAVVWGAVIARRT